MDFFDNRYYRMNKFLLSVVGLWPFQRRATKRFTLAFGIIGCGNFCIPQVPIFFHYVEPLIEFKEIREVLYIIRCKSDIDRLLTCMPAFFGAVLISVKLLTLSRNSAEFTALLNYIHDDWQSVTAETEKWILRKYAATGRKLSLCYSTLCLTPMGFYLLWPIVLPTVDIILSLNESRAPVLPYDVEYLIDEKKYYHVILIGEYCTYFALIPILVGSDITYIACTEHICGMFAVLSHRLENSLPKISDHLNGPEFDSDKYFHSHVISCIRLHIKTIILVELMTSIFSTFLLVDIGLGLIMHCAACVMIVVRLNQPSQVALCGAVVCTQSVRMYFNCRPGQELMDHSSRVAEAAYSGMWYKMPTNTRKLLVLIMMRGQIACMFVIAKLYVVNLNSFGVIMKTSLSYCTVMASVHDASYIVED